jgi:predicted lipoprotein with Yx(FWY)xxD motif
MEHTIQRRKSFRTLRAVGMAGALFAVGGVSTAFAAGTAGAQTSSSVATMKTTKFGTILVSGNTVYTLQPSKTACTTQCLKIWPEVLLPKGVTKAKAGSGVDASKLGTIKRSGGTLQVTYAGKPLYWFVGDTAHGQVNGNITDAWGKWSVYVTSKAGATSSNSGSGSSGGSSAGSGGVSF